jgi:hypothetical protein
MSMFKEIFGIASSAKWESPKEFSDHLDWAGAQTVGTYAVASTALAVLNPYIHHCRIGKVRLKQAA